MAGETLFICSNCDTQYPKWYGQCSECGKWGTIAQQSFYDDSGVEIISAAIDAIPQRVKINITEIDNVLGGGIVKGSLILLAGDPGVGKSTLVLQICSGLSGDAIRDIFYICGEESPQQISTRIARLNAKIEKLKFIPSTDLDHIIPVIKRQNPSAVIVDSIQTISSKRIDSEPGSATQVRACASLLLEIAKKENIPIIIVGHVTKDGSVAGPKLLEHIVDVVLYLEGDRFHEHRLLRSVKNRFGPTNQVGVFSMGSAGLEEVKNPSEMFLNKTENIVPGSVVSVIMEGARPFLIEIQALTNRTNFSTPKRATSGFDLSRLELLVSVLERRAGLCLHNQDIFLNVVGGLKVKDPALDLACSIAIASSVSNQVLEKGSVVLGEVGLGGEIRPISFINERIKESTRLGFSRIYIPDQNVKEDAGNFFIVKDITKGLSVLGIKK